MSFATRLRTALDVLLGPPVETRASAVGPLISAFQEGREVFPPRNSAAFASEAYASNTVAYFCISVLADAFGALSLQVFRGDNEVKDHPVLDLLGRPNPTQGGARFRRALMSHYLIGGTAYVEAVAPGKGLLLPRNPRPPTELWTHRPDRVMVIPGPRGIPQAFRFRTSGGYKDFPVDAITGRGYLLQIKDFHPLNDWYGLGGVEASARWIDLGNAGATANAALMANGGNPSALFATKSNLTDPQREQMRARLRQMYSGAENTGQPLIVGGEWTVTRLAATMADMQWTEGMHEAARNICSAFRVPHILVVPGESTYANREAADLELYDHAVLPRAEILLEDLTGWFRWLYAEDDLRLEVDIEAIPALETRREGKRKAVLADAVAGLISVQEARLEGGYGEVDKTDDFIAGPFAAPPVAPVTLGPDGKPVLPPSFGVPPPGAKPVPGGKPAAGAKPPKPSAAVPPGSKPRLVAGGKADPENEPTGDEPSDVETLDDEDKAAPADQPRHPTGITAGGQWKPRGPDDPPTAAETAAAEALAAELIDDGLMEGELAPVLADAAGHFARREPVSEEAKAWLTDPALHRLAEFRAAVAARAALLGLTTRQRVALGLARAMRGGVALTTALRGVFAEAMGDRVATIAQTEVVRAAGYGTQLAAELGGIPFKEWLCVAGDTRVAGLGVTHVARRPYRGRLVTLRSASGRVVTVTADHPVLTGRGWVAAHLVEKGDDLVRYVSRVEGAAPGSRVMPDVEDMPPTIEQVFGALQELAARPGMMPGVVDLQRHGAHGEIDVIAVDRDLLANVEPALAEDVRDRVLELSDLRLADLLRRGASPDSRFRRRLPAETLAVGASPRVRPGFFLGTPQPVEAGIATRTDGTATLDHEALNDAAAATEAPGYHADAFTGRVGGRDLGRERVEVGALGAVLGPDARCFAVGCDLGFAIAGSSEQHRLTLPAVAQASPLLAKQVVDLAGGAAEITRDLVSPLSGGVSFDYDRCEGVDVGPERECHVYDYSTANGWMIGNGLIIHNSQRDDRVRHAHVELDGQIVRTEEPFRYGPQQAMAPGLWGDPAMDINCRCISLPLRSEDEAKAAPRTAERDALWHAYDTELREFEARARDAVRRGFEAQERRAMVRLHERDRGAA